MGFRRILAADGQIWDVWESRPTIIDRRGGRERREAPRIGSDRRQRAEARVRVGPEFREGWLMFQSGDAWRRVAPIPSSWSEMSDDELLSLLASAESTARARRR